MECIWLEDKKFDMRNRPMPTLATPDDVLINVNIAGVCNTDLEMIRGYVPFTGIIGHEFVGTVVAGPDELKSKRVVGDINIGCDKLDTHDGTFAEYLTLPAKNCHIVAESIPDELAVFTEPLAAALEIQEQICFLPEHKVLVIGDGKLGLLITMSLASLTQAQITVAGKHREKLDLVDSLVHKTMRVTKFGFPHSMTDAYDYVIEATGNPMGLEMAVDAVRPRGTVVVKSTFKKPVPVELFHVVVDEVTILGSRCGSFEPALNLLESGRIDLKPMIFNTFPRSDWTSAIHSALNNHSSLKYLLRNV